MKIFIVFIFQLVIQIILQSPMAYADIKLEGLRGEDKALVQKYLSINPNPEIADNIIKILMGTGFYSAVQIFKKGTDNYIVQAEVLKTLSQVKFKGLSAIDEIEALNAIGLKPGSRINRGQLAESEDRLRELYGRSGYFNPEIEMSIPNSSKSEVTLIVAVKENLPCRIKGIKILSPNELLINKLLSEIKSFKGKIFSEKNLADMEEEARAFIRSKRMLSARLVQKSASYNPDKTEAYLVYDLSDPYTYGLQTKGNEKYTNGDLARAADLDSFDQSSLNPAAEIAERIRKKYLENGFADVKLSFDQTTNEKEFKKNVIINVTEGKQIEIKKIEVIGRLSRPPKYYANFIMDNSSDAIEDDYYVAQDLKLGYQNLLTELNNQGYLRAKLQSTRQEFNPERTKVVIQVLLDEGPLTQIKNIRFENLKSYTEAELLEVLGLKPNSPLRLNSLEQGIQRIKEYYRNSGYLEMGINNERSNLVTYDDKGYEASIRIDIYEGPQVIVREILVEGNTFTKDYVITKEIDIDVGDVLTPEKMDEAQKRLDRMNIFSRVEIRTLEANTNVSKRALIVSVTERNPGSFRMGLGITNRRQLTARGFAGISYSNLFGTARAVSLRVSAENNLKLDNYLEYEAIAGYLEPFLFNSRFRGRLNLSRQEKVSDYDEATSTSKITATNKVALLVERDITSKIRFTWNFWSMESVKTFQDPRNLPGFDGSELEIATIGPLLDIDYRDNPFLPTSGTFTRIEADYSNPNIGSSDKIEFVRTQATFTYYQKIVSPKWVWANSVRGGYERNLSKEPGSGIPRLYAFYLGGYTTIRGYSGVDEDQIPPSSIFPSTQELIIPDDSTFFLYKSELRYPIYGFLGGVLFYDAGRVNIAGNTTMENDPRPLKESAGIGIRINTPVGPLSLDYARKLYPGPGESPDHFHLSIGTF